MIIDRFNFYDVYGYLIPGLTFLILLWTPIALTSGVPPDDKVASLAAFLLVAYIVGHFLQSMATYAVPSETDTDAAGKPLYPTVAFLNRSDTRLGSELKQLVATNVREWFKIDVAVTEDAVAGSEIAERRQDAYNLCRTVVNAGKSYSEQFQGLYSMMRGISIAFWLAIPFNLGWALSTAILCCPQLVQPLRIVAGIVVGVGVIAIIGLATKTGEVDMRVAEVITFDRSKRLKPVPLDKYSLYCFAVALFATGFAVASFMLVTNLIAIALVIAALLYGAAGLRFFELYKRYTREHAKQLWIQFAAQQRRKDGDTAAAAN